MAAGNGHGLRAWTATRATGWRKISTSVWKHPTDPQIYGSLEVDAVPIMDAIRTIRERTGAHVTPTHIVTRAVARALHDAPEINARLVRGHFVPRKSVDVYVIVSSGAGRDLSGVKVHDADVKTAAEIEREVRDRSDRIRRGESVELEKAKRIMEILPSSILRVALRATTFLSTDLNLNLPALGVEADPFGGAMVTSVGMFGLSNGYAPLSPLYHIPVLIFVGQISKRPWVVDDRVEPHDVLPVTATIDHRWVDGWGVAKMAESFKAYLADPLAYETLPAPETERELTA